MSIASRITSMENNIRNAYHGLDSIGIDTTNTNKNIENISALLEDFYDSLPKVSGTGSNIQLTPTKKGRITSQINGDTLQETRNYKGMILLPKEITQKISGIDFTLNSDGSVTIKGTSTATISQYFRLLTPLNLNGTYTFSLKTVGTGSINAQQWNLRSEVGVTSLLSTVVSPGQTAYDTKEINATANIIQIYIGNNKSFDCTVYPILETGSIATDWDLATTNTSPNPMYPETIQSVTGTQNINVCGKNLFDIEDGTYKSNDELASITFTNGVMTNFTYSQTSSFGITIPLRTPITLTANQSYTRGNNSGMAYPYITLYNQNKASIDTMAGSDNGVRTYTPAEQKEVHYIYLWFAYNLTYTELKPMMNVGSTLETFEKYDGETYTIHLSNIELNKTDTYKDYITGSPNNWSIVNNAIKTIYNGTESGWAKSSNTSVDRYTYNTSRYNPNIKSLCNYFTYTNNTDTTISKWFNNNGTQLVFNFASAGTTTLQDWKDWLSTHNLELLQPLKTPTTTPITDTTLINDLNTFYYAMSKNGETNISVDGNLPIILDVSALKGEETE